MSCNKWISVLVSCYNQENFILECLESIKKQSFKNFQIVVADEVRVKWNAFDGEMGKLHNGRRGKVVSIRYGDIIVKTTDGKEPVLEGFHYTPQQLEKRVP